MTVTLRIVNWCIVAALLAFSIVVGLNKAAGQKQGPPEEVEVLTREAPQGERINVEPREKPSGDSRHKSTPLRR